MATPLAVGATIANPFNAAPVAWASGGFGGSKHHDQIQQGADPNQISEINLGQQGYFPSYDSNTKGSFEGNYNTLLNNYSPDQLINRYSHVSQNQLNTPLDQQNYGVYQSFKSLIGRDPTSSEWAQILPSFQGPNGKINGQAALANLQQQYKSNPNLDPTSANNNRNPADIQSNVAQQFKQILGRDATPEELSHFTQAIQTNQTDSYGLSAFLKQQPEYTNAQDQQFRSGLNNELAGYDTAAFNRQKGDVIAAYGKNGMAAGFDQNGKSLSPSLDYALTDLMGKLAENRSNYLAQLSSSQYGGNKDLAVGNYKNTLDQLYNQNQQRTNQQTQYGQQLTNQGFAGADYNTQRNDYMNFLNSQRNRGGANPLYGAVGGLVGAGIGGAVGGPMGASAGYQIGNGAGNAYGYLNY